MPFLKKPTSCGRFGGLNWSSRDGKVLGLVQQHCEEEIELLLWFSKEEKKGNAERALRELRGEFLGAVVRVVEVDSGVEGYWRKMGERGLIEQAYDGDGNRVFPQET